METTTLESAMNLAVAQARKTMNENIGGPFGAAVIAADGKILSVASNTVLRDHDPTAHAEIAALRLAGAALGSHDLSGCILVTTAFPCPMCFSGIVWANIKEVYFGSHPHDAAAIGFRDDNIYDLIKDVAKHADVVKFRELHRGICLELFAEYKAKTKQIF